MHKRPLQAKDSYLIGYIIWFQASNQRQKSRTEIPQILFELENFLYVYAQKERHTTFTSKVESVTGE